MRQEQRLALLGTMQRALDQIASDMPTLRGKPAIDIAARVNGLRLQCEKILEPAKVKLWQSPGLAFADKGASKVAEIAGAAFRAVLAIVPMPGFDVKALRADADAGDANAQAALAKYGKPGEQRRISFEVL